MPDQDIIFKEKQYFPKWTWIIVIVITLLFWGIFYVQIVLGKEVGTNPMSDIGVVIMTIIFGVIFPLLSLFIGVEILGTKKEIIIRINPFYKKRISLEDITKINHIEVNPVQQFGGWGIRWNGQKLGYIFEGNSGIEIYLKNGKSYVISSKKSEQLFGALEDILKAR